MYKVIVKFNNGTQNIFSYSDDKISTQVLTKDIGLQLYPDNYNPKINQYIKLIYMGKIISIDQNIIFDQSNPNTEQTFHCVVKKIPDDAFIIEKSKTMSSEEVNELLINPKFIELITQRSIFEFLSSNLDSYQKINDLISGKEIPISQESLITKYTEQIKILKEMGFIDENENELITLLTKTNGNVENVINILMS